MRDHQKYFALEDADGKLSPHFLAVLNTDSDPDGLIRHGNERVLRARFNDARFFWNTDQKNLAARPRRDAQARHLPERSRQLLRQDDARAEARQPHLGDPEAAGVAIRPGVVHKAALLCKADLTTELVKEFTELQGIVGGLYAKVQDLDPHLQRRRAEAIGDAIYDHYKPESMDDAVPPHVEGAVLSIADKADTIAGMFALGFEPTGSKDPFALRRAANGIVKIIAEHKLPLSLAKLFSDARDRVRRQSKPRRSFDSEGRLRRRHHATSSASAWSSIFEDARGFAYDVVNAVLAAGSDDVVDAIARAEALTQVRGSEDFASISVAFKRIRTFCGRRAKQESHRAASSIPPC